MVVLGLRVVFAIDSWLVKSDRVVVLVCALALTLVVVNEEGLCKYERLLKSDARYASDA
jgi:hypothetical protein